MTNLKGYHQSKTDPITGIGTEDFAIGFNIEGEINFMLPVSNTKANKDIARRIKLDQPARTEGGKTYYHRLWDESYNDHGRHDVREILGIAAEHRVIAGETAEAIFNELYPERHSVILKGTYVHSIGVKGNYDYDNREITVTSSYGKERDVAAALANAQFRPVPRGTPADLTTGRLEGDAILSDILQELVSTLLTNSMLTQADAERVLREFGIP